MKTLLLVATDHGLVVCQRNEQEWHETGRGLTEHEVTSVIAREGVILAGTTDGIYRSDDLGQHWRAVNQGLTLPHVRWLAFDPQISDAEFAGTEPAGIFVSRDGAETWRSCPEVVDLRDQHSWYLPYSPHAGCVRGLAFQGRRAYAAVEIGGVLRSDDGGDTWRLADGSNGDPDFYKAVPPNFVHSDVHDIVVHPSSPELVFAPTGRGFYASSDGGQSWTCLYAPCYCRAVWLDPLDSAHLLIGPAKFAGQGGRIEESHDGGQTWHLASTGQTVPWPQHMVERFTQLDDELFAVLSNGQLLVAELTTLEWRQTLPDLDSVAAVTSLVL